MKPFYAILVLSFLVMARHLAGQLAPWVGPNIKTGEDPEALPGGTGKNQAEPHVIRSVTDPDLLLATFQEGRFSDGGARCNGYAISEDGGFSWKRALNPHLTTVFGGPYHRATDPVAGIDHEETLYLNSLVSVDERFGIAEIVVQRSTDRGLNWTAPQVLYRGENRGSAYSVSPDKNWMAVNDFADSDSAGRILVTWTNFRNIVGLGLDLQDYLILSRYSDDGGQTWSPERYVTPPDSETFSRGQFQGSLPLFLPGGGLVVVYHRFRGSRIETLYSPDGGSTYPDAPVPVHEGYLLYDAPNVREGTFLPSAAVSRNTGDLYIAYTAKPTPQSRFGNIYFVRSDRPDKGVSPEHTPLWNFRDPVAISGFFPARSVTNPTLSVSPDGREVTVFFTDSRFDTGQNHLADIYAVQSVDGGDSWMPPFRLSSETFDVRRATETSRGFMLGDYFGIASPKGEGQAAVAVWVDTREPTADPWSARIGSLADGVFSAWLQAQMPNAARDGTEAWFRDGDPDEDGVPLFIEYLTGLSPRLRDHIPEPGAALRVLSDDTDPLNQVVVRGHLTRWPDKASIGRLPDRDTPTGEGYWDAIRWVDSPEIRRVELEVSGSLRYHLLEESAPVRWVREGDAGWVFSHWLGWLHTGFSPWLYHLSLGWLYEVPGALFGQSFDTWLFPRQSLFPWIPKADGTYLYVLEGTPWVFDTATSEWKQAG